MWAPTIEDTAVVRKIMLNRIQYTQPEVLSFPLVFSWQFLGDSRKLPRHLGEGVQNHFQGIR